MEEGNKGRRRRMGGKDVKMRKKNPEKEKGKEEKKGEDEEEW